MIFFAEEDVAESRKGAPQKKSMHAIMMVLWEVNHLSFVHFVLTYLAIYVDTMVIIMIMRVNNCLLYLVYGTGNLSYI